MNAIVGYLGVIGIFVCGALLYCPAVRFVQWWDDNGHKWVGHRYKGEDN